MADKEKLNRMIKSLVGSDRVQAELLMAILKEMRATLKELQKHPLKKWLGLK